MKFIIIKILKFFLHPFKDILLTLSREFIEKKMEPLKAKINGLGDAKKKKELMEDFDAHMSKLKWRCQNLVNKEIDQECRLDYSPK